MYLLVTSTDRSSSPFSSYSCDSANASSCRFSDAFSGSSSSAFVKYSMQRSLSLRAWLYRYANSNRAASPFDGSVSSKSDSTAPCSIKWQSISAEANVNAASATSSLKFSAICRESMISNASSVRPV